MAGEHTDAHEFIAWLDELSVDELLDHRFELYDRLELVDEDSQVYRWLRWELDVVYALEHRRVITRELRLMCQATGPGADPDAFAEAVIELSRMRKQLGGEIDPAEVFRAAFDVAERRAGHAADNHERKGNER